MRKLIPPEVRFWKHVDKKGPTECWLWTGCLYHYGYGQFNYEGAHRFSWKLVNGPIPNGQYVCHTCDIPICVNPDHLFLGTAKDNFHDAIRKGRTPRGENQRSAALTEKEVIEIFKSKESTRELADSYLVTTQTIRNIWSGKCWGWLTKGET